MSYYTRKKRAASERGKRLAAVRWQRDRAVRDAAARSALALIDWKIVRRIVVIDGELSAREIVFFEHDRYADRARKLREAKAFAGL